MLHYYAWKYLIVFIEVWGVGLSVERGLCTGVSASSPTSRVRVSALSFDEQIELKQ